MYLKPKKIIFESIIKKISLNKIKPRQENLNKNLINTLKKDIPLTGLLCPLVINVDNTLLDGHHRYEALKNFCTETDVYMIKNQEMEKILSKINSCIWFDFKGKLDV